MRIDCEAYGHDVALLAQLREGLDMTTPWHKSDAKPLLEKDMDDAKHLEMKPKALYQTRIQYREFSLEEFRKRINQEKDKRISKERRMQKKKKRTAPPPPDYEVKSVPKYHDPNVGSDEANNEWVVL